MERYMAKRTLKNIPDEIKNVVELFYLRGPDIACAEAARLRQTHPELNGILDDVLILFNHAPESVFMFYEALTQLPPELPDDLSFSVGNLMDDVSSSDQMALDFPEESATPDADLTFEALLNQSMNATAVPSVFADGSNGQRRDGKSYGNSGRSLSSRPPLRPNTDISLNIDIDFDDSNFVPHDDTPDPWKSPHHESLSHLLRPLDAQSCATSRESSTRRPTKKTAKRENIDALTPIPGHTDGPFAQAAVTEQGDNMRPTVLNLPPISMKFGHYPAIENESERATRVAMPAIEPEAERATRVAMPAIDGYPVTQGSQRDPAALSLIEPTHRIPHLTCKMSELASKSGINPKSSFILSMIDGHTSIADILDISSWSVEETASMLLELQQMGIIRFDGR